MDILSVPSGLLTHLRKLYPDKLPREERSAFEQGRAVGQQEVIDKLQSLHDKEVRHSAFQYPG